MSRSTGMSTVNFTDITAHPAFRALVEEEKRELEAVSQKYPPIERPTSQEQVRARTRERNRAREAVTAEFRVKYAQARKAIYAELGRAVPTVSVAPSPDRGSGRVSQAHAAYTRKMNDPLLARSCPECHQPSGQRCRTSSGNIIYGKVHALRSQVFMVGTGARMERG